MASATCAQSGLNSLILRKATSIKLGRGVGHTVITQVGRGDCAITGPRPSPPQISLTTTSRSIADAATNEEKTNTMRLIIISLHSVRPS